MLRAGRSARGRGGINNVRERAPWASNPTYKVTTMSIDKRIEIHRKLTALAKKNGGPRTVAEAIRARRMTTNREQKRN